MHLLNVDVTYALSPQAKGKVERPYRWLQDRIVHTWALEDVVKLEEVRAVLRDEVSRYNNHQVHSTTKEIPALRFRQALNEGNSLFHPFYLPKPDTSPKDFFCLREQRMVNGYRRISLFNHQIQVRGKTKKTHYSSTLIKEISNQRKLSRSSKICKNYYKKH